MNAEEILYYTDGHQVMVTNSFFKVKKTLYQLRGITRHGVYIIHPPKIVQLGLLLLGTLIFVSGSMNLFPSELGNSINFLGAELETHLFLMSVGLLLFAAGMVILWVMKDRYAVRIHTAEGEKDVVVSENKEYVTMIVEALNRAYLNLTQAPEPKRNSKFTVSPK